MWEDPQPSVSPSQRCTIADSRIYNQANQSQNDKFPTYFLDDNDAQSSLCQAMMGEDGPILARSSPKRTLGRVPRYVKEAALNRVSSTAGVPGRRSPTPGQVSRAPKMPAPERPTLREGSGA
ncbi:hypothetical protein NDU88_005893 [Pleurodeles waltl]|uniref:Uncharacterized protein n=1 Tax=Pleurodeles waltl TaxID=8319 RepID=A0AAV7VNY9_PLEWA|nr:hypothetical protein NDU88_005893 [Pleurodeles waltl]